MGRRKPFINKKNSATFHLLARDSSDLGQGPSAGDRVFVRVDNNLYSAPQFLNDDGDHDENGVVDDSIFADAPSDDEDDTCPPWISEKVKKSKEHALPENVRKEILEMGFPDDGYNYLMHMREITGAGGGSSYYSNPKARLDLVPHDVKAYDASRLRITAEVTKDDEDKRNDEFLYAVASKTVNVKIQRAVDPDVLRLLEADDLSKFGSDVEGLEEDFVLKANLPEEGEDAVEEKEDIRVIRIKSEKSDFAREDFEGDYKEDDEENQVEFAEKPRVRRLLDEQFDLLTLREYGTDDDGTDAGYGSDPDYAMDGLEHKDKYKDLGEFVNCNHDSDSGIELNASADIIRKCAEYAKIYCNEENDDATILVEESSDESEVWDCETIISTYSNFDNHPGKIQAPGNPHRRLIENLIGSPAKTNNVIALSGKEKLPVDFLPHNKKTVEKVNKDTTSGAHNMKRLPHGQESKEEKKKRKGAVKETRRKAREEKKILKGLYRCETQMAQKVAAGAGPSSIHLK